MNYIVDIDYIEYDFYYPEYSMMDMFSYKRTLTNYNDIGVLCIL